MLRLFLVDTDTNEWGGFGKGPIRVERSSWDINVHEVLQVFRCSVVDVFENKTCNLKIDPLLYGKPSKLH